jgi:hypothetical protein
MDLCKVSDWESIRDSHRRGPQSPVHVSYFSADESAHEDIGTIPNRAGHREDLSTLRMRPPASVNPSAGDSFDERGPGSPAPSDGFTVASIALSE